MIELMVNDEMRKVDVPLGTPVADLLRTHLHLPGTKIGCREGDCGACTILVGELRDGEVVYTPATSCLMPVGNAKGKHIVSIEGLNLAVDLNVVQQAFLDENGTQCGFCTPGFVISLVCFALSDAEMNYTNAISAIDGNICRCTGYKSIERAIQKIVDELGNRDKSQIVKWLVDHKFIPPYFNEVKAKLESIKVEKSNCESCQVMGGGTDLLVQELLKMEETENFVFATERDDLRVIEKTSDSIRIGAAASVESIRHNSEMKALLPNLERYIKLISSTQIRSMATTAGNLVNASPIGDLSILFLALDAELEMNHKGTKRTVPLKDFFQGYKKVDLKEGELVEWIRIPLPKGKFYFNFEKISKREFLDIATVNSALKLEVDDQGKVTHAAYSVGGVGPIPLYMEKSVKALLGKTITNETFKEINTVAQSEVSPRSNADYKRLLVRQELFAHLMSFEPDHVTLEALKEDQ